MHLGVLRYNTVGCQSHVHPWGPSVLATGTQTLLVTTLGSKNTTSSQSLAADTDILDSRRNEAQWHCCTPSDLHSDQRELAWKLCVQKLISDCSREVV